MLVVVVVVGSHGWIFVCFGYDPMIQVFELCKENSRNEDKDRILTCAGVP